MYTQLLAKWGHYRMVGSINDNEYDEIKKKVWFAQSLVSNRVQIEIVGKDALGFENWQKLTTSEEISQALKFLGQEILAGRVEVKNVE